MKGKRRLKKIFMMMIILFVCAGNLPVSSAAQSASAKKFKVLHIMSYHSDWEWNKGQFSGFKNALKGVDVEYRVFEMDTKRNSSKERIRKAASEAKSLIDTWKPDLVYANDDDAQEFVVKDYVNTDIPFVFSGVNNDPAKYGFVGSRNVTGVLEQEHFSETVRLLKEISPNVKRIAVIIDEDTMWQPVIGRMKQKQGQLPGTEFISWDIIYTFEEFKKKITEYQKRADALGLLGIFQFKDEKGNNVPYQEVLRWVAENSRLPDFSYWKSRVEAGTLCTITVSAFEQGFAAGIMAKGILTEGKTPSAYPMVPTVKGEPAISLARAKKLGLKVKSDILLTAEVLVRFEWEK